MKTKRWFAAILSAAMLLSFFAIGPGIGASAAEPCTIVYNANGGSGAPAPQNAIQGMPLTLTRQMPTRTGFPTSYKFLCWCTSPSGNPSPGNSADRYNPGDIITPTGNLTLYALWVSGSLIAPYIIRYDANGGIGTPPPQDKIHDVPLILSLGSQAAPPHRLGYVFKGWATDAGAAEAEYQTGEPYWDNAP